MKYKAKALYQRVSRDGSHYDCIREIEGSWFLEQAPLDVEEIYVRAKAAARIIDEVVSLGNYVPKSITGVFVEIGGSEDE